MYLPHTDKEERELQAELEKEKGRFIRGESSLAILERNVESIWKYGKNWRYAQMHELGLDMHKWAATQKTSHSL